MVKLLKTKNKEKMLKQIEEGKRHIIFKLNRMMVNKTANLKVYTQRKYCSKMKLKQEPSYIVDRILNGEAIMVCHILKKLNMELP